MRGLITVVFGGITSKSIEWIRRYENKGNLGRIEQVTIHRTGGCGWTTRFVYENAILMTDGFSTGYCGEGPTGLLKLLAERRMWGPDPRNLKLVIGETQTWSIKPLASCDLDLGFLLYESRH